MLLKQLIPLKRTEIGLAPHTGTTIIPIAAGKGGVGKTFLTANLGLALAEYGKKTIVIDLHLGGSNLHSFLGLSNQYPGVGEFMRNRQLQLESLLAPTVFPNLRFLPGDSRTPFMPNITHAQKERLIAQINHLQADYVLIDLGAGTSFHTLDFFRMAPYGLLLTSPEYPSVMGLLAFLKYFLLRAMVRTFARQRQLKEFTRYLSLDPMANEHLNIDLLRNKLIELDPLAVEKLLTLCRQYRPRIVFNMGTHPNEIELSEQINKSLSSVLAMKAEYLGFIFQDPAVAEAVRKRAVFLPDYGESPAADDIRRLAERIVKFWHQPIEESAVRLQKQTQKLYKTRLKS
ncbi:MAG: MinD/ParA family protein [Desulfobacteraceae bacterium]|nr:MAG: MinD/ParA family protein [Desulfobacteraceae bacterium]